LVIEKMKLEKERGSGTHQRWNVGFWRRERESLERGEGEVVIFELSLLCLCVCFFVWGW